jgi:septal ring factor EnvC (AmiA/AmiB activator)
MPAVPPTVFRCALALVAGCAPAACGTPAPSRGEVPAVDQRLSDLERRVEKLETRPAVEPPLRSKAEIEAHIKSLETERSTLLVRYSALHPEIRNIDRQLSILNQQLKMLEQQP